jgi:small subunit ribosomal protein S17
MSSTERNLRAVRIGEVISNKMEKTVVVKIITRSSKLVAHDESNECRPGDIVKLMSTRPLSKTKRWRVAEIIERAK